MGIEILLGVLVIPLAQKVGEKWIDQIATGISDYGVDLLKQVISDPSKEQEVKSHFRDNPNEAEKVVQNVATTMKSDDMAASIAATIIPSSGEILKYYSVLINWIVRYGSKLGRDFVLKGFLNGERCLSYFTFQNVEKIGNSDIAKVVDGDYVSLPTVIFSAAAIHVEHMRSTEARDKKFVEMNRSARLSQNRKLPLDALDRLDQVERIYEHYVWYDTRAFDISYLPRKEQDRLEIATTYEPIHTMIRSLWELFEYRAALIEDLKRAIKGVEL